MFRTAQDYRRFLLGAGIVVPLLIAVPVVVHYVQHPHEGATLFDLLRWLADVVVIQFAIVLALRTSMTVIALVAQSVAASLLFALPPCYGFEGALLVIIALQLGFELPRRPAIVWSIAQSAVMFLILWWHWNLKVAFLLTGAYLPFQILAVMVSSAVSELLAARELLAQRSRLDERLRISRDLHDVLGHHLVALSLQLELATKTPAEEASEHLAIARSLAVRLLDDVRGAVHDMRAEGSISDAVNAIAAQTPRPSIQFESRGGIDDAEPAIAETLVRCVQEIVTNAAKHSAARNLHITIDRRDGRIELRAVDDGGGAARFSSGGGLKGMSERLHLLGGGIEVHNEAGRGVAVVVWVPCPA